jgi:hypothetical protein
MLHPFRRVAQEGGKNPAIDESARRRAEPEIVHKNGARFSSMQEAESELERPEIFRAIDQDDIAGLDQVRENKQRIPEATFDVAAAMQSFRGNRGRQRTTRPTPH